VSKVVYGWITTVALTCASCGSKNGIYPVAGKVTYQGAPAAGATVFFHRQGGKAINEHMVMGIVRADGTFELVCGSLGKGAPPGTYDVLIEWKPVSRQGPGRAQRAPDRLQGRYADPKSPRFQAAVKTEDNQLAPFDVTE
jgi:hypothetical protein